MRLTGIILCAISLSACYSYVPVSPSAPAPVNSRVSLDLTTRASADNMQRLGTDATQVQGVLLGATPDSLWLAMSRVHGRGGGTIQWGGERLGFDLSSVVRMRERKFSKLKTVIAIVGTAAIMYGVSASGLVGFARDGGRSDPREKPPVGGT
jgi:hypothetical protein